MIFRRDKKKWEIELGIYDIKYVPRTSKKGQVVADFLIEIQSFEPVEKEMMVLLEEGMRWTFNSNGACKRDGARVKEN